MIELLTDLNIIILSQPTKGTPGSERHEFEGRTYAGYKDSPGSWVEGEPKKEVKWYAGRQYDADTSHAKFVLATIAFGGGSLSGHGQTVCNAQLAVDGDTEKYPEFQNNVKAIDARPFWREEDISPNGQGYHYNPNAETYMEVGDALGRVMAALLARQ